jgi:hypothetical protein
MNSTTLSDMLENIQEKYMSAIQLHTGIGDRDLGALDLALGMALGDLDAAWQRQYDGLMIAADELANDNARLLGDNAQLLGKLRAVTESTVNVWRNGHVGGATGFGYQPVTVGSANGNPIVIVEAAALAAADVEPQEADDGDAPLVLAGLPDDEDEEAEDEAPPFPFQWKGQPPYLLAAVADLELGRPWRLLSTETRRAITLAAIHELQAAQRKDLSTRDFNRSKPHWMPTYSTLWDTLGMTWEQMTADARRPSSS